MRTSTGEANTLSFDEIALSLEILLLSSTVSVLTSLAVISHTYKTKSGHLNKMIKKNKLET